jgi:hypothetical protein
MMNKQVIKSFELNGKTIFLLPPMASIGLRKPNLRTIKSKMGPTVLEP